MEKHQIIRPRKLIHTPFLKFSFRSSIIFGGICIAGAFVYNYIRSEETVYVIQSGYYHDPDLQNHVTRMSLMKLATVKPKNESWTRIDEEDAIGAISERPLDIPQASVAV